MRKLLLGALAGLSLGTTGAAEAAAFYCVSPIIELGTSGTGNVTLGTNFSSAVLTCGLGVTVNSVSPQTCQAWYATFLSAQSSGKSIRFYFETSETHNGTLVPWDCSQASFGSWVWRVPYFIFVLP